MKILPSLAPYYEPINKILVEIASISRRFCVHLTLYSDLHVKSSSAALAPVMLCLGARVAAILSWAQTRKKRNPGEAASTGKNGIRMAVLLSMPNDPQPQGSS